MDEYGDYEGSGVLVLYLFLWITLCCLAASLFWIKDRVFKKDKEISKMKLRAVFMASMAGAIQGFMLSIPVLVLVYFILSFLPEHWRRDEISWSTQVTILVTYFACVLTCAIRWLLSQDKIIVDLEKDWKV